MIRPTGPTWDTRADLRKWLLKTVPGLQQVWDDRELLKLAHTLQIWLGCKGTFSHKNLLLNHKELGASQLLSKMLAYEGGVWCGGMATCFVGLLRCFPGVYAAKWGYGLHSKNISHVTTLVGQKDGKAFIFDAYLGYIYTDSATGDLLEFTEVLRAVRDKQYQKIKRVDICTRRPAVAEVGDPGNRFNWCFGGKPPVPEKFEDRWVYHGAEISCKGLFALGTHNRNRIEAVRGDVPFEHFMLDLLREEVQISRWVSKVREEISSTAFALMRHLVQELM